MAYSRLAEVSDLNRVMIGFCLVTALQGLHAIFKLLLTKCVESKGVWKVEISGWWEVRVNFSKGSGNKSSKYLWAYLGEGGSEFPQIFSYQP